jgi:hypothetical protein
LENFNAQLASGYSAASSFATLAARRFSSSAVAFGILVSARREQVRSETARISAIDPFDLALVQEPFIHVLAIVRLVAKGVKRPALRAARFPLDDSQPQG